MNVALVGCGNIAARYAEPIAAAEGLALVAATDILPARADAFVAEHGGTRYATLDELLADDSVDVVVNLTAPQAHAAVTASALEAGKHVHSEKPLALRYADAQELVALAAQRGLRLSCAPTTLLGEAQQTAWKLVRDGAIGRVRAVYAEANWDRIERWHPDPTALYGVGPLVDVGVYPITIMTAMFGPCAASSRTPRPSSPSARTRRQAVPVGAPDFVVAVLELADGVVARVTANFYVPASKQRGLEFHGDEGSLYLPTWGEFDSRLELQPRGGEYATVPPCASRTTASTGAARSSTSQRLIAEGRPHRMSAEHAAHVVEILCAVRTRAARWDTVDVRSDFVRPQPMDWAR